MTTRVILAEGGRLAFVWPAARLSDRTEYTLTVSAVRDQQGRAVVPASVVFTTATPPAKPADPADVEEWVPDAGSSSKGWRSNRPPSPWESLAPLMGPLGVTAISGRALTLDGRPLARVTLEMEGAKAESDRTGRFLLLIPSVGSGRHVLEIHGDTANRPARTYGFFDTG